MSDRDRPLLPPRLRDWKPGTRQVGLFIRDVNGGTVQASFEEVDKETATQIADIIGKLANRKGKVHK